MAMEQHPFMVTDLSKSVSRYIPHNHTANCIILDLHSNQLLVLVAFSGSTSTTAPLHYMMVGCMIAATLISLAICGRAFEVNQTQAC